MRFPYIIVMLFCFLLVSPAWLVSQAEQSSDATLKVFITARIVEAVDSATKKQLQKVLKEKATQAKDQKKALEKQLKSQLGGDKDKWPPEKQEELKQAEDAEKMVLVELDSLDIVQKDLTDTAEDIKRSIQGEGLAKVKKWVHLVESAEEADLTAEVICRRREGVPGLLACVDCNYFVYLKITPEAGINAEHLAQIAPKTGWTKGVRRIHQYKTEEPFWIIEASSSGRWGNAANQGAGAVNDFIEENESALKTKSANN